MKYSFVHAYHINKLQIILRNRFYMRVSVALQNRPGSNKNLIKKDLIICIYDLEISEQGKNNLLATRAKLEIYGG